MLDYLLFISGTLATLLVALLLDAIFGDPDWLWRRLPHPVSWFGWLIELSDKFLNQSRNTNRFSNYLAGVLALLILTSIALFAGIAIHIFSQQSLFGAAVQTVIVAVLLAQQSLFIHVKRVVDALKEPDIEASRTAVSMIVGRDADKLERSGIARASIESTAENLSDGVVGPAFWFAIAGMPGLLVYKMVNTADSMIGHKSKKYEAFGWASARFDDLLNLVPARLTAVLIALSAPLVGGSIFAGVRGAWKEARLHPSPNAGWPEVAMAHALDVRLAGPRVYGEVEVDAPYFNPEGQEIARRRDIVRALRLMVAALVLQYALVLASYAALA